MGCEKGGKRNSDGSCDTCNGEYGSCKVNVELLEKISFKLFSVFGTNKKTSTTTNPQVPKTCPFCGGKDRTHHSGCLGN